jgi:UDP-galactose transporter B1
VEHHQVIPQIVIFAIAGAIGQSFIYYTIYAFNSLVCSLITTTRKFFSILASVIYFGHSLTNTQWFGVGLVFAGLGLDMYNSNKGKKTGKHE